MKPAPFKYVVPETVDEALALVAEHGDEGKLLAGGQSLVPAMNFRLAQPEVLIDLNRITDLAYIEHDANGGIRIGAMTRQAAIEHETLVREQCPLLHAAMPFIAHSQIRNRGTVGGSLAHADPAAELPAVMIALGARFKVANRSGERWIAAAEFFPGLFQTALQPDEIIIEVEIPPRPEREGWAFEEVARRHGDYALAGAATVLVLDKKKRCQQARMVLLSVGESPVEIHDAEKGLIGQTINSESIEAAAESVAQAIDPPSDIHASKEFRRHLAKVMARRTLQKALQRAQGSELS